MSASSSSITSTLTSSISSSLSSVTSVLPSSLGCLPLKSAAAIVISETSTDFLIGSVEGAGLVSDDASRCRGSMELDAFDSTRCLARPARVELLIRSSSNASIFGGDSPPVGL